MIESAKLNELHQLQNRNELIPWELINTQSRIDTRSQDLKRCMFSPRDMTAMALKFLLSRAEMKDWLEFGAILTVFDKCTEVGMCAIVKVLMTDARSRVYWDHSEAGMLKAADLTKAFAGLPGAVVAMIDGKKLEFLYPSDLSDQNRDYNGWTHDVFQNLVLVWDPEGKIVDVGVNLQQIS